MNGFPRFFRIAGYSVNSYKCFLCVGIYVGSLAAAALADRAGFSPLRVGLGAMACALAGLFGARIYHLAVHASDHLHGSWRTLWDTTRGGWGVFGALLTFVPASFGVAAAIDIPAPIFWDCMGVGILAGGFWIRLGCVFNGCCVGRETRSRLGITLHDTRGITRRRVPVQFLEMIWWLAGLGAFVSLWPDALPQGGYGPAVLGWYGFGRFFLEPFREESDVVFGRVRINQLVAAFVALTAAGGLGLLLSH